MACSHCHDDENKTNEHESEHNHEHGSEKINMILLIIGIVIFLLGFFVIQNNNFKIIIFVVSYVLCGYDIIISSFKSLLKKNILDENMLVVIATVGAMFIDHFEEGVAVLVFFKLGEYIQEKAANKYREHVKAALDILPKEVGVNSFKYNISNGPVEGKNNLIKVLKRISFGFKNLNNFRNRILMCEL